MAWCRGTLTTIPLIHPLNFLLGLLCTLVPKVPKVSSFNLILQQLFAPLCSNPPFRIVVLLLQGRAAWDVGKRERGILEPQLGWREQRGVLVLSITYVHLERGF